MDNNQSDFSPFARRIMLDRYAWPGEDWPDVARRVTETVLRERVSHRIRQDVERLVRRRVFMPGGRYLANAGREFHQVQNCLLLDAEDTREGWADLAHKSMLALTTGAGIGVVYSKIREEGRYLRRTGGTASGPLALMQGVNELGRAAKQGGHRRAAIWAGLHWSHPDVHKFIAQKDWPAEISAMKARDWRFPAPMDHTNISVILDDAFFAAYDQKDHADHGVAHSVFWSVVNSACRTGDPGFSVDVGDNAGEHLRNACTEVSSADDSDICNLGSVNLARVGSLAEMREAVELGTLFLLAGTLYSDLPYAKVGAVREKNRRLGLGLMGVGEFAARHGGYGSVQAYEALAPYLAEYTRSTGYAARYADEWGLSRPVKTRAVAPVGTIGIVAETTTGIEPVFCKAYLRRYRDGDVSRAQYVADPTARRLREDGIEVEDAYDLATDPNRRLGFQSFVQMHVDHGISSTINLPAWSSRENNPDTVRTLGATLLRWLPHLRGVTVYPDGGRSGQPFTPCSLDEALAREGEVVTEAADVCDLTRGGSCGS